MTDPGPPERTGWVRELLAAVAFLAPAELLAVVGGATGIDVGAPLVAAAAVVLLGRRAELRDLTVRLPIALIGVAVPALSVPSSFGTAALAGATGVGLLVWLSMVSGTPAGPRARVAALLLPAVATAVALGIAGSAPGLSAGPGLAALLLLATFAVLAGAAAWRASEPEVPPDVLRPADGARPTP